MTEVNKNTKKICSFYASDWHLVTMLLPNIDKKIKKETLEKLKNLSQDYVKRIINFNNNINSSNGKLILDSKYDIQNEYIKKVIKKTKMTVNQKIILMNLEWLENIKIRKKKRNLKKH